MSQHEQINGMRPSFVIIDELSDFSAAKHPPIKLLCPCGVPAAEGRNVCDRCESDLRALTHPSTKDAVLHLIADIGEGSTSLNSLSHIARLARHGLTLES